MFVLSFKERKRKEMEGDEKESMIKVQETEGKEGENETDCKRLSVQDSAMVSRLSGTTHFSLSPLSLHPFISTEESKKEEDMDREQTLILS